MDEDATLILLPTGKQVVLTGDPADLSVFSAVKATGAWEPDLGAFLSSIVKTDWVCVDIGANIGCHTLALADLIVTGHVIAIDASDKNMTYLRRNVAALPGASGRVRAEKLALWSRPAKLYFAGMDALAGCNFVAPASDDTANELLIRDVLSNPALADHPLRLRTETVDATTLDAWWERYGGNRLDLIKLDVEGAETNVISGALSVIQRFDPVLITEYNPACAVTYQGDTARRYYDLLANTFEFVSPIGSGGMLGQPLLSWKALEEALVTSGGWLDLCCSNKKARMLPDS